jgi:cell division transport system permease protein
MTALLSFSFSEALGGLRRGWRSSLLALLTTVAAVFVAAAALLTSNNAREILARLGGASEMTVYLKTDTTPADRQRIATLIQGAPAVASHRLVTPEEALRRFATDVPDLAPLTASLGENPFPAAFEVRLRPDPRSGAPVDPSIDARTQELVASLAKTSGVDEVRYDRQVIDRLLGGLRLMERIGATLSAVLLLAAVLTIASVLRLSYQTRRDEIAIMYLVGAPPRAVRGPFVAEGLLLACFGAMIALTILAVAFGAFRAAYGTFLADAFGLPALWFLPWTATVGLIIISALVGGVTGLAASWRER